PWQLKGEVMASVGKRVLTALGAFAVTLVMVMGVLTPAQAANDDYPTWQDVKDAKANEAAKKKELDHIESLMAGLKAEVKRTEEIAKQRGRDLQEAQLAFDLADRRARD